MGRTAMLVAAWLLATLVAVLAASAAVRVVASRVSAELPPPLPQEVLLEADPLPSPTPSPPTPEGSPEPGPASSPPEGPASPDVETRTVHTVGGSTALRVDDGRVSVLWATPNHGFTVTIDAEPTEVRVEFRSEEHRSRVRGRLQDARLDVELEERGDDGR